MAPKVDQHLASRPSLRGWLSSAQAVSATGMSAPSLGPGHWLPDRAAAVTRTWVPSLPLGPPILSSGCAKLLPGRREWRPQMSITSLLILTQALYKCAEGKNDIQVESQMQVDLTLRKFHQQCKQRLHTIHTILPAWWAERIHSSKWLQVLLCTLQRGI